MIQADTSSRIQRFRFVALDAPEAVLQAGFEVLPVSTPEQVMAKEEAVVVAEELPPPPPTFSEAEMAEAKAAGYQAGFAAGKAEAEARAAEVAEKAQAAHNALLETIANRMMMAAEAHAKYLESQQGVMVKTAMTVARKVAEDALKREPYAVVETLLKECSDIVAGSQSVVITVPTAKLQGLQQSVDKLKQHLTQFKGQWVLEGSETLAEHDCRVAWKNGMAERSFEALWSDIEALISRATLNNNE